MCTEPFKKRLRGLVRVSVLLKLRYSDVVLTLLAMFLCRRIFLDEHGPPFSTGPAPGQAQGPREHLLAGRGRDGRGHGQVLRQHPSEAAHPQGRHIHARQRQAGARRTPSGPRGGEQGLEQHLDRLMKRNIVLYLAWRASRNAALWFQFFFSFLYIIYLITFIFVLHNLHIILARWTKLWFCRFWCYFYTINNICTSFQFFFFSLIFYNFFDFQNVFLDLITCIIFTDVFFSH